MKNLWLRTRIWTTNAIVLATCYLWVHGSRF